MRWQDDYKINIPIIDTQHKQLFNTYGELNRALREGLRPNVIKETLERLQHYVARHFTMEEKYMRESGYPGLDRQIEEHENFSGIFSEIMGEFSSTGLTPSIVQRIRKELGEWLVHHVVELDMDFGRFYNNKEDASPPAG